MSGTLESTVHFLQPGSFPGSEKPYLLRFEDQSEDQLPTQNYNLTPVTIPLINIRPQKNRLCLPRDDIAVLTVDCAISPSEFDDHEKVTTIWLPSLIEAVRDALDATSVIAIPHVIDNITDIPVSAFGAETSTTTALYKIRKRDPEFPISTGKHYKHEQPTNIAHIDASQNEFTNTLQALQGTHPELSACHKHQWVNVWKPLTGPLTDWPLGLLLRTKTGSPTATEEVDVVFTDRIREIELPYPDDCQQWGYLRDQTGCEHLMFLQCELSEGKHRRGIAHASFKNPDTLPGERPRESIEVKLLVSYSH